MWFLPQFNISKKKKGILPLPFQLLPSLLLSKKPVLGSLMSGFLRGEEERDKWEVKQRHLHQRGLREMNYKKEENAGKVKKGQGRNPLRLVLWDRVFGQRNFWFPYNGRGERFPGGSSKRTDARRIWRGALSSNLGPFWHYSRDINNNFNCFWLLHCFSEYNSGENNLRLNYVELPIFKFLTQKNDNVIWFNRITDIYWAVTMYQA